MPRVELELEADQIAWMDALVASGRCASRSALAAEAIMLGRREELYDRLARMMRSATHEWLDDAEVVRLASLADNDELLAQLTRLNFASTETAEGVCMLQPVTESTPPTDTTTGVIEAIDLTGDTKVHWSKDNEAEVAMARTSFDTLKQKGYVAYRLGSDGSTGAQMDAFDPAAERILMMPQMRGG